MSIKLPLHNCIAGEQIFDIAMVTQLEQHSHSEKPTYAYYYTQPSKNPSTLWSVPDWLRTTADHGDEITFVFGYPLYIPEMKRNKIWDGK